MRQVILAIFTLIAITSNAQTNIQYQAHAPAGTDINSKFSIYIADSSFDENSHLNANALWYRENVEIEINNGIINYLIENVADNILIDNYGKKLFVYAYVNGVTLGRLQIRTVPYALLSTYALEAAEAKHSQTSDKAKLADSARSSAHSVTANSSLTSNYADSTNVSNHSNTSGFADTARAAGKATLSDLATYASTAAHSAKSDTAFYSLNGTHAKFADTSLFALDANHADFSSTSAFATNAMSNEVQLTYLLSKVEKLHQSVLMLQEVQTVSHGKLIHNIEQVVSQSIQSHQQLSLVIQDGLSVVLRWTTTLFPLRVQVLVSSSQFSMAQLQILLQLEI